MNYVPSARGITQSRKKNITSRCSSKMTVHILRFIIRENDKGLSRMHGNIYGGKPFKDRQIRART